MKHICDDITYRSYGNISLYDVITDHRVATDARAVNLAGTVTTAQRSGVQTLGVKGHGVNDNAAQQCQNTRCQSTRCQSTRNK